MRHVEARSRYVLPSFVERTSDRPIEIYINSPGGSLTAMTAVYDTMPYVRPRQVSDRATAEQAVGYGLVDLIIPSRKLAN